MYCIKCGTKLPDDAIFCVNCGTKTVPKNERCAEPDRSAAYDTICVNNVVKSRKRRDRTGNSANEPMTIDAAPPDDSDITKILPRKGKDIQTGDAETVLLPKRNPTPEDSDRTVILPRKGEDIQTGDAETVLLPKRNPTPEDSDRTVILPRKGKDIQTGDAETVLLPKRNPTPEDSDRTVILPRKGKDIQTGDAETVLLPKRNPTPEGNDKTVLLPRNNSVLADLNSAVPQNYINPAVSSPATAQDQVQPVRAAAARPAKNTAKKSKAPVFVIIGALIVAAVCAVFFLLKPSESVSELLSKADSYYSEQDYSAAENAYSKALVLEPMNVSAYLGKAKSLAGQDKRSEAIEVLSEGYSKTGDKELWDYLQQLKQEEQLEE